MRNLHSPVLAFLALIAFTLPTVAAGQQEEFDQLREELRPELEEFREQYGDTIARGLERALEKEPEVRERGQLKEDILLLFSTDGSVDRAALFGRVTIAIMQDEAVAQWAIELAAKRGLTHPSEEVRLLSTLHLSLHQTFRARIAVPLLFNVARTDSSVRVRRSAIRAIGRINPSESATILSFQELLVEKCQGDGSLVEALAVAIAEAGTRASYVTPDLLQCLDRWRDEPRRAALIWAVGQTADDPASTIPRLAQQIGTIKNRTDREVVRATALISEKIPLKPDCDLKEPLAKIRRRGVEDKETQNDGGVLGPIREAEAYLQKQSVCPSGFWSTVHFYWNFFKSMPGYLQALFGYFGFFIFSGLIFFVHPRAFASLAISWPPRDLGTILSRIPNAALFFGTTAFLGETPRASRAWLQYHKPHLLGSFEDALGARATCVHFYPDEMDPFKKWNTNTGDVTNLCFWIQGVGGAGKTTLAVHLANQWSMAPLTFHDFWIRRAVQVPILVSEDWQGELLEYIRNRLAVDRKAPTIKMVKHLANGGNILLVVDGLSERRNQERVVNEVHACHQDMSFTRMIVTSRAHCHSSATIQQYEVGPVPLESLEDFVSTCHQVPSEVTDITVGIRDLARGKPIRPLFVVLAIEQYEKGRKIPDSKIGLVRGYLESIAPQGEKKLSKEGFEVAARTVARYCFGESLVPGRRSYQELVHHIDVFDDRARKPFRDRSGESVPAALILEQLVESGLLEKITPLSQTLIGFSNDPVAEFLLAEELLRPGNEEMLGKFESRLSLNGEELSSGLGGALQEVRMRHARMFR